MRIRIKTDLILKISLWHRLKDIIILWHDNKKLPRSLKSRPRLALPVYICVACLPYLQQQQQFTSRATKLCSQFPDQ